MMACKKKKDIWLTYVSLYIDVLACSAVSPSDYVTSGLYHAKVEKVCTLATSWEWSFKTLPKNSSAESDRFLLQWWLFNNKYNNSHDPAYYLSFLVLYLQLEESTLWFRPKPRSQWMNGERTTSWWGPTLNTTLIPRWRAVSHQTLPSGKPWMLSSTMAARFACVCVCMRVCTCMCVLGSFSLKL